MISLFSLVEKRSLSAQIFHPVHWIYPSSLIVLWKFIVPLLIWEIPNRFFWIAVLCLYRLGLLKKKKRKGINVCCSLQNHVSVESSLCTHVLYKLTLRPRCSLWSLCGKPTSFVLHSPFSLLCASQFNDFRDRQTEVSQDAIHLQYTSAIC